MKAEYEMNYLNPNRWDVVINRRHGKTYLYKNVSKSRAVQATESFNRNISTHVQSALSSKITAIKEKFGFTYYRTKYPTDIALILEIERDQILNELEG